MSAEKPVKIAILGPGTVGSEVLRLLRDNASELASRIGAPTQVTGVYVRDTSKERPGIDAALLTDNAEALVDGADVVVELMGGTEPARSLILRALKQGKAVVTANKALLAEFGPELYEAADANNADLYFEAAVAGAIPLVRPMRESLAGDQVQRVMGIVNGTTNYILDQMTTHGLAYEVALKEAQDLGYAEADPTADVEGLDAAAKASILASLAFHQRVALADVHCEGISSISATDVALATASGYVIKLLAIAERTDDGLIVRVNPTLVPQDHPLAGVRGAFNAVFVEAQSAGELMFYGRGAGGTPTASAVLGDVVSVARHIAGGGRGPRESNYGSLPVLPISAAQTRFQIRLRVPDRPGVLAATSTILAARGISIETVRQNGAPGASGVAELIISTHRAPESDVNETVAELRNSDAVVSIESVLRIEGE